MNTNNVYYGMLRITTKLRETGCYYDNGTITTMKSNGIKPVLVLVKKNIFGKTIIKDLNSGEKYTTVLPLETGKLHIITEQLLSFKLSGVDIPENMSKKKVLSIGNKRLEEIYKHMAK